MTACSVGLALDRHSPAGGRGPESTAVELTPIDLLLGRQSEPTPVERFARLHESDLVPTGERWWRDRLPSAEPEAGQQYAFSVDLDGCTGCKACVSACNNLNGLDQGEQWRTVTTIHGDTPSGPSILTVSSACHHCVEPACLAGCPVDAYEKDPVTGIVAHLDDQCIGCSYCTLTCPYEVPLYNPSIGIVRKCDMCRGRLEEGEAPACVQGCPNGAITITVVDVDEVVEELKRDPVTVKPSPTDAPGAATVPRARRQLHPGAPDSTLTVPTTRYRSTRTETGAFTDHRMVQPGHAHTPLAVMLTLTQVAVGTTLVDSTVRTFAADHARRSVPGLALAVALVALAASTGHLGRPLYAWRAVIGFRHSWLSREIVAFGAFAGLGLAHAGAVLVDLHPGLVALLRIGTGLAGLVGVACSVLLYAVTGRAWWRVRTSAVRFAGTMVGAGGLLVAAVTLAGAVGPASGTVGSGANAVDVTGAVRIVRLLLAIVAASTIASLVATRPTSVVTSRRPRSRPSRPTGGNETHSGGKQGGSGIGDLAATRHLLRGPLSGLVRLRIVAAVLGGLVIPLVVVCTLGSAESVGWAAPAAVTLALVTFTVGEFCDRRLFFLASVAPRRYGDIR